MSLQNFDLHSFYKKFESNGEYLRDIVRTMILGACYQPPGGKYIVKDNYYVSNFIYPDSEEELAKKIKDPVDNEKLTRFDWINADGSIKTEITYKINQQGFRSAEFTPEDALVCFGCSYTYGVGLPEEQTWPHMLSKHYNIPAFNLGIPGHGLDLITFYAMSYLRQDILKPKAFFVLVPPPGRLEMFLPSAPEMPLPQHYTAVNLMYKINALPPSVSTTFLADALPMTSFINSKKNIFLLQRVADFLGIPCIVSYSQGFDSQRGFVPAPPAHCNETIYARDLMHPGQDWQARVAQTMIDQLPSLHNRSL